MQQRYNKCIHHNSQLRVPTFQGGNIEILSQILASFREIWSDSAIIGQTKFSGWYFSCTFRTNTVPAV